MSSENFGAELIAAIKEKNIERARELLSQGADPRWSDEKGLNALDYAQLNGDKDFYKEVLIANRKTNVQSVLRALPTLKERVLEIPDMSFRFNWKVYSWMPLVTMFCPYDVWSVFKLGAKLRIDSTTADWTGSRWARGDVSLYIDAGAEDPMDSFIIVDNNTGETISLLREMEDSDELDMDVDNMMQMDLLKGSLHPEVFKIERSKGTFGRPIDQIVHEGMWQATPYDLTNAKITFLHFYSENFGKNPEPIEHVKTYSGQFWCSSDFPVQPEAIKPFLEAVTPFPDTAKNILTLLGMFNAGMPVKAVVQVFPTVKFAFELTNYSDDVSLFRDKVVIPTITKTPETEENAQN